MPEDVSAESVNAARDTLPPARAQRLDPHLLAYVIAVRDAIERPPVQPLADLLGRASTSRMWTHGVVGGIVQSVIKGTARVSEDGTVQTFNSLTVERIRGALRGYDADGEAMVAAMDADLADAKDRISRIARRLTFEQVTPSVQPAQEGAPVDRNARWTSAITDACMTDHTGPILKRLQALDDPHIGKIAQVAARSIRVPGVPTIAIQAGLRPTENDPTTILWIQRKGVPSLGAATYTPGSGTSAVFSLHHHGLIARWTWNQWKVPTTDLDVSYGRGIWFEPTYWEAAITLAYEAVEEIRDAAYRVQRADDVNVRPRVIEAVIQARGTIFDAVAPYMRNKIGTLITHTAIPSWVEQARTLALADEWATEDSARRAAWLRLLVKLANGHTGLGPHPLGDAKQIRKIGKAARKVETAARRAAEKITKGDRRYGWRTRTGAVALSRDVEDVEIAAGELAYTVES